MLIDIEKIKITDRIRKDFGNIQELADDINQNGLINPPVVNKDYVLLAGERRLRALKKLGWKQIPVTMMDTRNAEHDLEIEISENEVRKDFSKSERIDYARRLERIESAKAEQRMKAGKTDPMENFPQGTTRDIIAKKMEIGSGRQYEKEKAIVDYKDLLDPKDFAEWDDGKLSTNKVYQKIKAELKEKEKKIKELENREPQVKEVIKEIVPDDYEKAKEDARIAQADFRNMQKAYEEMADKWKAESLENEKLKAKNKEPEIQRERDLKLNAAHFIRGINLFLEEFGGYTYLMKEVQMLEKADRERLEKSVSAIYQWANEMLNSTVQEVI